MGWDPVEALAAIRAARPIATRLVRRGRAEAGTSTGSEPAPPSGVRRSPGSPGGVRRTHSTSSGSSAGSVRARAIDSDPGRTVRTPDATKEEMRWPSGSHCHSSPTSRRAGGPGASWGRASGPPGRCRRTTARTPCCAPWRRRTPRLRARGPVQLVVSLPPTARLWAYADEVSTHFAGVTLVPYTDVRRSDPDRGDAGARPGSGRCGAERPSHRRHGRLRLPRAHRLGAGWPTTVVTATGRTDRLTLACVRRSQPRVRRAPRHLRTRSRRCPTGTWSSAPTAGGPSP